VLDVVGIRADPDRSDDLEVWAGVDQLRAHAIEIARRNAADARSMLVQERARISRLVDLVKGVVAFQRRHDVRRELPVQQDVRAHAHPPCSPFIYQGGSMLGHPGAPKRVKSCAA
jgi:hypothetical protein